MADDLNQVHLSSRQIRVLAHPLRVRLLGRLRGDGPATATQLAGVLGTNTGATSYHLRQLADAGLVVEEDRPGGGRQRRWSLALLAVLVTVASALGFVVLWMNAGGREPVLALRHDVTAGQTIEDDDLQVVRVAADPGIDPIASSARDEVVGRPAAADLLAGTLLVPGAVGNPSGLEAGQAVIAVPVSPEELPADLEGGDRVVLEGEIGEAAELGRRAAAELAGVRG